MSRPIRGVAGIAVAGVFLALGAYASPPRAAWDPTGVGTPAARAAPGGVDSVSGRRTAAATRGRDEMPGRHLAPGDPALERLQDDVTGWLTSARWRPSRWGVLAVSLETGDTLLARDPDRPLAPASNLKLFTTAAALHYLGPDYRYSTFLLSSAEIHLGVLEGDLVLYGTGDPGLSGRFYRAPAAVFDSLARELHASGVRMIAGDVLGDGTFFEGPDRLPEWDPRDLDEWFAAASAALSYNENVVRVWVEPSALGQPPRVHTLPSHGGVPILNEALTVAGHPRRRLALVRDEPTGPIRVTGELGLGSRDVWRRMTVQDPVLFAAYALAASLERAGIVVLGGPGRVADAASSSLSRRRVFGDVVPDDRVLARHTSPPLSDYLVVLNKKSHNLFADLVLRTIGRIVEGEGSYRAGTRAVERFLVDEVGVPLNQVRMLDGSGLASADRASAGAFVRTLRYVEAQPYRDHLLRALPEAGSRDLPRMRRTPAAGNLRGKTGTIDGVSALTGIVSTAQGERVVFSVIGNDLPSEAGAKRVEDRIVVELASLRRALPGAEPLPDEPRTASARAHGGG